MDEILIELRVDCDIPPFRRCHHIIARIVQQCQPVSENLGAFNSQDTREKASDLGQRRNDSPVNPNVGVALRKKNGCALSQVDATAYLHSGGP